MTCICKGTKSKESVIQDAVNKYKEIYIKVSREATKLDEVRNFDLKN